MGMLDTLTNIGGMLGGMAPGIAYLQSRKMGGDPIQALAAMQQMSADKQYKQYIAEQRMRAAEEEERRREQARQAQIALEAQQAAFGELGAIPPEQRQAWLSNPVNAMRLYAPGTDAGMTQGVLGAMAQPVRPADKKIADYISNKDEKVLVMQTPEGNVYEMASGKVRAPGPGTVVNVDDKSLDVARQKLTADWENKMSDEARSAMSYQQQIARLEPLLNQIQTGRFAPVKSTLGAVLEDFGVDPAAFGIDPNLAPSAEAIKSLTNKMALGNRQDMPGAMSDADRSFLVETVPQLKSTPLGNKIIIQTEKAIAGRKIDKYTAWLEYSAAQEEKGLMPSRQSFELQWMKESRARPMFPVLPADPAAATVMYEQMPDGTIYTRPDGRVVVKGLTR
jgi:hypothetical protein